MNFGLTSEQLAIRDHVKTLLDDVCNMEYVARCDEKAKPPVEAFQALGLCLSPYKAFSSFHTLPGVS